MTEQAPALTRHDLEAKIIKRCWQDQQFRTEFTVNPEAAFVKYLEVPAESLPRVVVHEETPGSWHIVLPLKPANANKLSDQDLERVAGGATVDYVTAVLVFGGSATLFASPSVSVSAGVTLDQGW
jgi:hypothetical protein